jgi:anaerobic selenocysteine-containing dehydrogenase
LKHRPFHREKDLSVEVLEANPHGIDLGPLTPSLTSRLQTGDGKIDCAPAKCIEDVTRIKQAIAEYNAKAESITLIGRRHVRSNNSWMHNSHRLVKGKSRDQLLMHPDDMRARNVADGDTVEVESRVGAIRIVVQESREMMPGVVSLPHGFGHARTGTRLAIATQHAGESANDLTDDAALDPVSGNAVLNGVPVEVRLKP